jgi:hypothetical protein
MLIHQLKQGVPISIQVSASVVLICLAARLVLQCSWISMYLKNVTGTRMFKAKS